jgi:phenylalanyl-tRNA synthetase beta chain
VVDITNYVLLEWGQPLHGFDRDRLQSVANSQDLTIGVRFAQAGEILQTLDGQERKLHESTLLITANDQPVALGGVMGGEATEVHEGTENVLLEAAYFDSAAIRRSARGQGLRTEASARYERGVNLAELATASNRALQLMTELTGGSVVAQDQAEANTSISLTRKIELRLDRVNQVLGPIEPEVDDADEAADEDLELQPEEIKRILEALGCEVTPTDRDRIWSVVVPPYRYRDLEREIDLIEEIARLYGYNQFSETLPSKTEPGFLSVEFSLTQKIREALRAAGLTEVMHYSVGKPADEQQVVIANPLFAEFSALRTNLLSGLIDAFQYNLEQGNGALNGFEIGRIFWSDEDGLAESDRVSGILGGDPTQGRWQRSGREQPMTWFEAKGVLEGVFARLGVSVEYRPDRRDERLHPGRTASLWLSGERLGTFGQLHPQLRQQRELPDAVYVFDLDLDVLLDELDRDEVRIPSFQPYSPYPASDRDIAFYAPLDVAVADIERTIQKTGGTLLESVELFDEYRGENVPAGQRSLAFRLIYRASDRTLTDEDVEPVHQKVREALEDKFQVDLRS